MPTHFYVDVNHIENDLILSFAKMNFYTVFLKTSKELTTPLPTMSKFVQILIPSHIRKLFFGIVTIGYFGM